MIRIILLLGHILLGFIVIQPATTIYEEWKIAGERAEEERTLAGQTMRLATQTELEKLHLTPEFISKELIEKSERATEALSLLKNTIVFWFIFSFVQLVVLSLFKSEKQKAA